MVDFITLGNALEDLSLLVGPEFWARNSFQIGVDLKGELLGTSTGSGGGALNSARALRQLGLHVAPMACLGDDERGKIIRQDLQARGAETSALQRSEKNSGISIVLLAKKSATHAIFFDRGANQDLIFDEGTVARLRPAWIFVTSLLGDWKQTIKQIINARRKYNFQWAWNPGQTQLAEDPRFIYGQLANVDMLHINRKEMRMLLKNGASNENHASGNEREMLGLISRQGVKYCACTAGIEGAWLAANGKIWQGEIMPVESVDSTGAGDAFGATLAGMLYQTGGDVKKSLAAAMVQSALVTKEIGASNGLGEYLAIEKLIPSISIHEYGN